MNTGGLCGGKITQRLFVARDFSDECPQCPTGTETLTNVNEPWIIRYWLGKMGDEAATAYPAAEPDVLCLHFVALTPPE